MDIEQLKLILETIQNVSGEASRITLYWLALKAALPLLVHGLWACVVISLAYLISTIITRLNTSVEFMREMRDLFRIGCPGMLSDIQARSTQAILRKLASEYVSRKPDKDV